MINKNQFRLKKMNCSVCGKQFQQKAHWHEYCSPRCKQAAWAVGCYDKEKLKEKIEKA